MRETKELKLKHKIPKTNDGITLIALVITIIVMLILVAVTISMAVNGGLFDYAKKATGETQNAINAEQQLAEGKITIGNKTYNSINEYIEGEAQPKTHNWTETGGKLTCSHCNVTYDIGQPVKYTASGSSKLYGHKLGITDSAEAEGNEIAITGEETDWVVLGIKDSDNDSVKETLVITTLKPVGVVANNEVRQLTLAGAEGYKNAVSYENEEGNKIEGELDRICRELYSNSEYGTARSITAEDINNYFEYEPKGVYIIYSEENGEEIYETENLNTNLEDLDVSIWNAIKAGNTPDGTDLGKYKLNGYYYDIDGEWFLVNPLEEKKEISEIKADCILGSSDNSYDYWLASRGNCVISEGSMISATFSVGRVLNSRVDLWREGTMFLSIDDEELPKFEAESYLRPIVELKDKLPEEAEITFSIDIPDTGLDNITDTVAWGTTWEEWVNESGYKYGFSVEDNKSIYYKRNVVYLQRCFSSRAK